MSRRRVAGVLALALFALPLDSAAQETTGEVRGRLVTPGSGPVVGAVVVATGPAMLGERRSSTASDGVFTLRALPPGVYSIRVAAIGYRATVIKEVHVVLGRVTGLGDQPLETAALTLDELTITAPRVTLDPVRTTVGATLSAGELAALPAERDYKALIAILPHVNTSYLGDPVNAAGSTGLENVYFIDGVNVTSARTASHGTSLPYNFVRSTEVRIGGYEAQFGRALGAIVNAVTYTGTNELEAAVFGFFTHDALTATPKAQPILREGHAYSYDIGARVSGPVVRDRLWFSAAYNPRISHAEKEIGGLGSFPERQIAHSFAGKVTWKIRPGSDVQLSIFGDPATADVVGIDQIFSSYRPLNADPYLFRSVSGMVTVAAKAAMVTGRGLAFDLGLARSSGSSSEEPRTERGATESLLLDNVDLVLAGGRQGLTKGREGRTSVTARATWNVGRHTPVLGVEYEDASVYYAFRNTGQGLILRDGPAAWTVERVSQEGDFHSIVPTAFAQDAWRATDRLTVSAGIRWSSQYIRGASGSTAQRLPGEWQPRIGFSWQTGRTGKNRWFGSYGRFYQQEPLNLASIWYVDFYSTNSSYSTDPRLPESVPDSVEDTFTSAERYQLVDGVKAGHVDELTLGYERRLGPATLLTIRGMRRELRSGFQWAYDPSQTGDSVWVLGTPGKGDLSFLAPPRREYTALEVGIQGEWLGVSYRASYVLSRLFGNDSGLFGSDKGIELPGFDPGQFSVWSVKNSVGLLPNDRTHVAKLAASGRVARWFEVGTFATIQSGTPLNEFGAGPFGPFAPTFLVPRGTAGRSAPIWDLNFRMGYDGLRVGRARSKIILDLLHVGNPRRGVVVDQQRFFGTDEQGNQTALNPQFLHRTAFQPPMTARIGFEVTR